MKHISRFLCISIIHNYYYIYFLGLYNAANRKRIIKLWRSMSPFLFRHHIWKNGRINCLMKKSKHLSRNKDREWAKSASMMDKVEHEFILWYDYIFIYGLSYCIYNPFIGIMLTKWMINLIFKYLYTYMKH